MKPEIKAKWCEALRSGEYKQGYGSLRQGTGVGYTYCCLGVLTDLYRLETNTTFQDTQNGCLPIDVAMWADVEGISAGNPMVGDRHLAEHNDGLLADQTDEDGYVVWNNRKDFKQIADLIEQYL